jgi:hypothetical protein
MKELNFSFFGVGDKSNLTADPVHLGNAQFVCLDNVAIQSGYDNRFSLALQVWIDNVVARTIHFGQLKVGVRNVLEFNEVDKCYIGNTMKIVILCSNPECKYKLAVHYDLLQFPPVHNLTNPHN